MTRLLPLWGSGSLPVLVVPGDGAGHVYDILYGGVPLPPPPPPPWDDHPSPYLYHICGLSRLSQVYAISARAAICGYGSLHV
jgi:hypothetical protein